MIYTLVIKGTSDFITFDCVTSFRETVTANVTSLPVETGYPVSDSMVMNLPQFNLSGIITHYGFGEKEMVLENGEFVLRGVVDSISDQYKHQIEMEANLRRLITDKLSFSLYKSSDINDPIGSVVEIIDQCVCDNIDFPYEAGRSGAIFPTLSIKKLFISSVMYEDTPKATPSLIKNRVAKSTNVNGTSVGTDTKGSGLGSSADDPVNVNPAEDGAAPKGIAKLSENETKIFSNEQKLERELSILAKLEQVANNNDAKGYYEKEVKTLPDGRVEVFKVQQ